MKYVFIGGVTMSRAACERYIELGADIRAIFSLADKYAATVSGYADFDDLAARCGAPNYKVEGSVNAPEHVQAVRRIEPDYALVIGCSQMIGPELLRVPRLGCVGHHPTMLPMRRGRAPIPWTLIHGLEESGVTMFFLDEGVDTGDILIQKRFKVDYEDDASTLYDKISRVTLQMVKESFPLLESGNPPRIRQDHSQATVWERRRPEDGVIDWGRSSRELYNWVRGLTHPYPGAFSYYRGNKLIIWRVAQAPGAEGARPGTIIRVDPDPVAACSDGGLRLVRVQSPGGEEMDGREFAQRCGLGPGHVLGAGDRDQTEGM